MATAFQDARETVDETDTVSMKLPADTHVGTVALSVSDLGAMSTFYEQGVGLERLQENEAAVLLGSRGKPLLLLSQRPELQSAARGAAGLYHTAILFEERPALAAALYGAASSGVGAFTGSADHLVSLAFYFNDPEGNGVELYWDRPRDEWQWADGQVAMDSLPLDPNRFIAEYRGTEDEPASQVGATATIGHVHLKVGDIPTARAFYVDTLGLAPTMSSWPSALFTAAGGYHHHVGMNIWESRGAGLREPSLGLESFELVVPGQEALDELRQRLAEAGVAVEAEAGATGIAFRDPWGTLVKVVYPGALSASS